jgi:hypothetical protein
MSCRQEDNPANPTMATTNNESSFLIDLETVIELRFDIAYSKRIELLQELASL